VLAPPNGYCLKLKRMQAFAKAFRVVSKYCANFIGVGGGILILY